MNLISPKGLHPSRALKKKRDKTNYLNVKERKEKNNMQCNIVRSPSMDSLVLLFKAIRIRNETNHPHAKEE